MVSISVRSSLSTPRFPPSPPPRFPLFFQIKIKSVMLDMIGRKLAYLHQKAVDGSDTDVTMDQYRQYRAYRERILTGLPREDGDLQNAGGADSDDLGGFLKAYQFSAEAGEDPAAAAKRHSEACRATGWTPLRYAVMARQPTVVATLLDLLGLTGGEATPEAKEADLECPLTKADWAIFRNLGMTILHESMATSTTEIIEMLLVAGADPVRFTKEEGIGGVFDHPFDALMTACVHARHDLVVWWGQRFPGWNINNADGDKHPFGVMFHAAHHGGKKCVEALMNYKDGNKVCGQQSCHAKVWQVWVHMCFPNGSPLTAPTPPSPHQHTLTHMRTHTHSSRCGGGTPSAASSTTNRSRSASRSSWTVAMTPTSPTSTPQTTPPVR